MAITAITEIALQLAAVQPDLGWLAGYWLSCEDGREVAEVWSDPRNGISVGFSVTLRGDRASYEHAIISPIEGRLAFTARPGGQEGGTFAIESHNARNITFANPAHDFPTRITYARDGDALTGRIEGTIDGAARTIVWRYRKAELNARCPAG